MQSFCEPRHWISVSKYLVPIGMQSSGGWPVRPPKHQAHIAQLAADYPREISLQIVDQTRVIPEFNYLVYSSGQCEVRTLPSEFVAPPFVASIKNGLSFGRHCCVIGPAGNAVRETGFNLDGMVDSEGVPIRSFRPRYWRKRLEGDLTMRPWLPSKRRIEGCVAVLNTRSSHNFYHWLIKILPRLATLRRADAEADYYLVDSLSLFSQNVFRALGIQRRQLIQPHCRLLLEAELLLVPSFPTATCLRACRGMLCSSLALGEPIRSARRIFITRRKTGTRTLLNESELLGLLRHFGFEVHAMENYTLSKQAELILNADIIMATHGAGLANLMFARHGTQVIEIVPLGRSNATCYPELSRQFNLVHHQIISRRAKMKQVLDVSLADVANALEQATAPGTHIAAA
ncbi:MAG: glycosyltransferase family 61 protein [Pirellulales bacterium]|nr:glycosyltransferase family 61 protein [Pirellulales bacterium]